MMKKFDSIYDNVKELRTDLLSLGQKVHSHAVSIKQIEEQFSQLSSSVNPNQQGTLPINTIKNPKNVGQCMVVTT